LQFWYTTTMRIRPAIVTMFGTCCAIAAIAIVMVSSTPEEAGKALLYLVWVALFLAAWGSAATLILFLRQSMSQAVWAGLVPALALVSILAALRQGLMTQRLLLGSVLATLTLTGIVGWRLRHPHNHDRSTATD
jgi:hypothetical protein